MKQHEDHKTLDLLESSKRGRGRPRLENANSQAERARLYRLNKKLNPAPIKSDVTDSDILSLSARNKGLNDLLSKRDAEILALQAEQARLIDERFDERSKAFVVVEALNFEIAELKTNKVTRSDKSFGLLESKLVLANSEISTLAWKLDEALAENIALTRELVTLTQENHSIKRDESHKLPVKPSRKTDTKKQHQNKSDASQ